MRTQPKVGILSLCLSHTQSFGLFLTKYIFTSDLPFFLNLGKSLWCLKNLVKAVHPSSMDLFTAFEYTSLIHALSGLFGMYSLLSHTRKPLPVINFSPLSYKVLLWHRHVGKCLSSCESWFSAPVWDWFPSWSSLTISSSLSICFLYLRSPYNLLENTRRIETISCTSSSCGDSSSLFTITIVVWNFMQNFSNQS